MFVGYTVKEVIKKIVVQGDISIKEANEMITLDTDIKVDVKKGTY